MENEIKKEDENILNIEKNLKNKNFNENNNNLIDDNNSNNNNNENININNSNNNIINKNENNNINNNIINNDFDNFGTIKNSVNEEQENNNILDNSFNESILNEMKSEKNNNFEIDLNDSEFIQNNKNNIKKIKKTKQKNFIEINKQLCKTIQNKNILNNNKNNNNISFENNLNNNNIIKLKKKSKTPINKNNINLNNNFLFKNNNNIITFDTFKKTRNNINNIFNNNDKTKKIKTKKKPLHYNLMNHSFIPTSNVLSFNLYNSNREKDFNNNTFNNNNHKKILSKSMTKEQRKNYLYPKCHGEFMYKSFMENLPKKEKKRQEIINEREKELYKELIFHPKINKNSKYNNKNNNNKIEDSLINYGENIKKKINDEIQLRKNEEEKNFYKPKLNKNSNIIYKYKKIERVDELKNNLKEFNNDENDNENNINTSLEVIKEDEINNKKFKDIFKPPKYLNNNNNYIPPPKMDIIHNVYDYLYIESKLIQNKKEKKLEEEMKKNCPFKPELNNNSMFDNVKCKLYDNINNNNNIVNNSINNNNIVNNSIINNNSDNINNSIKKSKKNNKYYNPLKNKEKINKFYDKNLMYSYIEKFEENLNDKLNKKKNYLEKSYEIIYKLKIDKYKKLFDLLDSDNDGFISTKKIKLSVFDNNALEIFTPILEELQKKDLNMNFKDFCVAIDKYLITKNDIDLQNKIIFTN